MIQSRFSWRLILTTIAIVMVSSTIFYSQYLAGKIGKEERKKVTAWVEAQKTILNSPDSANINLATLISTENTDIPIIETTEKDSITGNYLNIDSTRINNDPAFLTNKLKQFKKYSKSPIVMILKDTPYSANHYYYGESKLLKDVKLYPLIQFIIALLFIAIAFLMLRTFYKSNQNQLWASMAKETAHQLGTPVSSLSGWTEILKERHSADDITTEIEKDVQRLQLIAERFSKIGSTPQLIPGEPLVQVAQMLAYIKKRASGQVQFEYKPSTPVTCLLSPPLFDWVIENLLKNALDALEGNGKITITAHKHEQELFIDVTDTGKGISESNHNKVFEAGYTTKKRGWGIGLTLSKRIMEEYHKGKLLIIKTEPDKGTTFRVVLPLQP